MADQAGGEVAASRGRNRDFRLPHSVEGGDFGGGEGAVVDADVVEGAVKKLLFPCVKSLAQRALRRFVNLFQRKYEALFGGQLPSSDGLTQ